MKVFERAIFLRAESERLTERERERVFNRSLNRDHMKKNIQHIISQYTEGLHKNGGSTEENQTGGGRVAGKTSEVNQTGGGRMADGSKAGGRMADGRMADGRMSEGSKTEEEQIRQMLVNSNIKAPTNLKYRIMQQVITEEALKAKKAQGYKPSTTLSDIKSVFITMYVVLGLLGISAYFIKGKEYLLSTEIMWTAILITLIFSLVWLAISADSYLKGKRKKKAKG